MKNRAILVIVLAMMFACLALTACSSDKETNNDFKVNLGVECESNFMFSRYDVNVYVDDTKQGTIDHGQTGNFELNLAEGKHTIRVADKDRNSVDGSAEFNISKDSAIRYTVHCTDSQVELKEVESIKAPVASSDLKGKSSEEIVSSFRDAGFTDVTTTETKDLTIEQRDKVQSIEKVVIDDNESFTDEDTFFEDSPVVISIHALADVYPPDSEEAMEKLTYDDAAAQFKAAGFTNIAFEKTSTTSYPTNTIRNIAIENEPVFSDFTKETGFSPDAKVTINYYDNISSSSSSDNYSSEGAAIRAAAKKTFEEYGQRQYYPQKFECHWLMGRIALEDHSDGSCFVKVDVTITSSAGAKIDSVAEGTVIGGTVVDFYVS